MNRLIKTLIFVIIFFGFINKAFSNENILIKIKIDNEIITNFDLEKEKKYLIALNPNLKNLKKNLQIKIAKDSIIKEIIKKNEIKKYFKFDQRNEIIDIFIKNLYSKLGLTDENSFENYLNDFNWTLDEIKKKIEIETLWNQLIFDKYSKQVQINEVKLKKKIEDSQKNEFKTLYNLSEIVFNIEKNKTLESTISSINGSILEIGFDNTANLYSISDSAKVGGKIGWIDENSLSSNLINSLKSLKKGQYSKPISLSSKFIILKINDIKKEKKMIDKDKELKKLILSEENRQLNNFSKIYFDKLKINTKINEF